MFCKNGVLKNFTKFIGKNLCWRASNFIKKETLTQLFSYKFCKIFKIAFFTEYFRWLLFSYIEHYLAKPESIVGRFSRDDFSWYITLRGKCLYSEHFWPYFSPFGLNLIKYGVSLRIQSISPYSVQMRQNTDQKNSDCSNFSCSVRRTTSVTFISMTNL